MRVAVMQPYLLPYIGYFQLIAAVDKFVLLDDVNYIVRGWVNRNRVFAHGEVKWLTVPLVQASRNRLIRDIVLEGDPTEHARLVALVEAGYHKAPQFKDVFPLLQKMLAAEPGLNLSTFLLRSLEAVCGWLGVATKIIPTSSIHPKGELRGQERILDICKREGATTYINPPGGRDLYDRELFASAGVQLHFLEPQLGELGLRYSGDEGPVLSIADLMMLNPREQLQPALSRYVLT